VLIIELLTGHPVQPSTMATLMAIFLSASLGTSLGLLVYSLLGANDPDREAPPPGGPLPPSDPNPPGGLPR